MRDVISEIDRWLSEGASVALATVVSTWGSAPRGVGAKMALTGDGRIIGSVSGGCVEGAVFDVGVEVLKSGRSQLVQFGVADENAWDIGLACGGNIEIFVEPLETVAYNVMRTLLVQDQIFATTTVINGPEELLGYKLVVQNKQLPGVNEPGLDNIIAAIAQAALDRGKSQREVIGLPDIDSEPVEIFVEVFHPAPTLIVIGGVHIAIALTSIANSLGYRTVIVDPRRAFSSRERFPHVDRLIQAWPDEAFGQITLTLGTAVASLTHDPKIDDPALQFALSSPAFYVGALGSRKTHAARSQRLLDAGMSKEQVDFIHGPIGLDISAQTPEEIALAIMAEIVAARRRD